MAIFKEWESQIGVTINYWKIDNVTVNLKHNNTSIQVVGYFNEDKRRDEKDWVATININADSACPDIPTAYAIIKEHEFFIGATDIF